VIAALPLTFERPEWLWLLLIVPLVVAGPLIVRSLAAFSTGRRWLVLLTRAALLVALILAMAGAQREHECKDLTVVYLLDRSHSIPQALQSQQMPFVRQASFPGKRRPDDTIAIISFEGQSNIEQLPMRGVLIDRVTPPIEPDRTDLSRAIQLALATLPEGTAKRIVVLSDGNENTGNAVKAAAEVASIGVGIDVVPLEYEHADDVMVDQLVAPARANLDQRVTLRMVLRSRRRATGSVVLYCNGRRVSSFPVDLKAGINPFSCEVPVTELGIHEFEVRFEPDDPTMDDVAQNNVGRSLTFVDVEGKVLLLTTDVSGDVAMASALRGEQIDVELANLADAPEDVLELLDYDAIILSNVPADRFAEAQKESLAAYVRNLGGGLIMTGGDESFGAGGWLGSAVEDVMPVRFDVKHRKQILSSALILVIDKSGSMAGQKIELAREAAKAAVRALGPLDKAGVVAFDGAPYWVSRIRPVGDRRVLIDRINGLGAGGGTHMGPALGEAGAALKGTSADLKHVIALTDGRSQPSNFRKIVRAMADSNITVSTVAVGSSADRVLLKRIAEWGKGRHYFTNDPTRIPQIFIKETKLLLRSLIRETPDGFRPRLSAELPEITAGIVDAELPVLYGHVLTTPRMASDAFSQVLMMTDQQDPLLAVRQCELGKTVAFTSGGWARWGRQWARWPKFGKFWAQTTRWSMRQGRASDFEVSTRLVGRDGRVMVEALDRDASFLNGLDIAGDVLTPGLDALPVRLHQTGPGRYEGRFPISKNGHYVVMLGYRTPTGEKGLIKTGLSLSYSPEYREPRGNEHVLREIAERTGGEVLDSDGERADVFRRPIPLSVTRRAIWNWLLAWFVLPLLLLDVGVRRLASVVAISVFVELVILVWLLGACEWYAHPSRCLAALLLAEAVGWTLRWRSLPAVVEAIASELQGLRSADAAVESVGRLKSLRETIREEMAARNAPVPRKHDGDAPDASAWPDADQTGDQDVGGLNEALRGPGTHDDVAKPRRRAIPPSEDKTESEPPLSRLLQTKARLRRRGKEDGKG